MGIWEDYVVGVNGEVCCTEREGHPVSKGSE
jgi:hypothetical protein